MKRLIILTSTAVAFVALSASTFAAPKKKTAGDTAKGIIDALLGDDKRPAAAQGKAAAGLGGNGVQFPKEWTNTQNGKMVTSVSPDGSARVIVTTVTGDGADGPWDDVQAKMANHLAPHLPGLTDLAEVSTEHDVIRDGVGLRVVTYTAKFNGVSVDIVVDFARENNVDGKGLVLIIRCSEKGNAANQAAAKKVAESLRLKK